MSVEFLDTNIFIYLFDETNERKKGIAERIVQAALAGHDACISHQVIQETLNVVTRKLATPMSLEDAQSFLSAVLLPLWKVMPSAALYQRGLQVQDRYRFSFYDSLIVAAALEAGCTTLYSEDMQHGQQIDGLTIENPFIN